MNVTLLKMECQIERFHTYCFNDVSHFWCALPGVGVRRANEFATMGAASIKVCTGGSTDSIVCTDCVGGGGRDKSVN